MNLFSIFCSLKVYGSVLVLHTIWLLCVWVCVGFDINITTPVFTLRFEIISESSKLKEALVVPSTAAADMPVALNHHHHSTRLPHTSRHSA